MKKQLISLSFLLSLFLGAEAQNFKNDGAPVNYLSIPKIVQDASINTYNVVVIGSETELNQLGYNSNSIASKINLRSFTRVENFGDNKIVFRFGGYGNINGNLLSRAGGDGRPTWYYTYTYGIPVSYEIYAGARQLAAGEIRMSAQHNTYNNTSNTESITFTSGNFPSASAAEEYWYARGKADALNHVRGNFETKIALFAKTVADQIDYQDTRGMVEFGYFKTTHKENFTDYENAAESGKRALSFLVAGQPRTDLRSRLDSSMTFWSTRMATLDPTNKDQDKMFFVCANNLATAYFWLDNIDSAMYFIGQAKRASFREGYLSMLKGEVENRGRDLANVSGSGVNPYLGPYPVSAQELSDIQAKIDKTNLDRDAEVAARTAALERANAPVILVYDGYIINRQGEKITGIFRSYRENTIPAKRGRTFFVGNGTDYELELSPSFMNAYAYDSKKFEIVKHANTTTGLGKEYSLCEVLYESDSIKVYKHIYEEKHTNNTYSTVINILYKRPTEETATNTSNIVFTTAFKKSLAKYFEGCPSVSSDALAGKYTNSDAMRIAAAVDYSNCK